MEKKIIIIKDGPYKVCGGIKLSIYRIIKRDDREKLEFISKIETSETYFLCRCGKSNKKPFCDGIHSKVKFDGKEVASREPYTKRSRIIKGNSVYLLDDDRCAYARFCHFNDTSVWSLIRNGTTKSEIQEGIQGACECITGRLTVFNKEKQPYEIKAEPEIILIEDFDKKVSGGIFVRGKVPLYSSDGSMYELRDRYTLCRCGHAENMPFCDALHINSKFKDGLTNFS
ncbi:MAG: CDGSH iron-sulfur domain-containing protein [Oscillospiraceae bacterium]|nr:CDGSH iron-sulfur domain-containing protein [Oscillospiraceae bacterium]